MEKINKKWIYFALGDKKRLALYKKLRDYLSENFGVNDTLLRLQERAEKHKAGKNGVVDLNNPKTDFGRILGAWRKNIIGGASLSQAMKGWIPEGEFNLISAGEEGMGIEAGFMEAIEFTEATNRMKKIIINKSIYPAIMMLVVTLMVWAFYALLSPVYLKYLDLNKWPDIPLILYHVGKIINDFSVLFIVIVIGLFVVISKTIADWNGSWRERFDKLPPWSIYKRYCGSVFLISLASMMSSGKSLSDSLKSIKESSGGYIGFYVDRMINNLKMGGNSGKNLDVGLLDKSVALDVQDYSELGSFERALQAIGKESLDDSVETIGNQMGFINQLSTIFIIVLAIIFYISTVQVSMAISDNVSSVR